MSIYKPFDFYFMLTRKVHDNKEFSCGNSKCKFIVTHNPRPVKSNLQKFLINL